MSTKQIIDLRPPTLEQVLKEIDTQKLERNNLINKWLGCPYIRNYFLDHPVHSDTNGRSVFVQDIPFIYYDQSDDYKYDTRHFIVKKE